MIDLINKPMIINCVIYCDYRTSEKLSKLGYNSYTEHQFYVSGDSISTVSLDTDSCMMTKLISKKKNESLIYRPSVEQALLYIKTLDPNWVLDVNYDNNVKGYYFIVKNKEKNYEYRQPSCPDFERPDAFVWGIEHILNRI